MREFGPYQTDSEEPLKRREESGHVTEVWRATRSDTDDGRQYAVKVYHPRLRSAKPASGDELESDPCLEFLEGVKRLKKAKQDGGDCLASVYDFGRTDGEAWYATDFCERGSLEDSIARQLSTNSAGLRHVVSTLVTGCLGLKRSSGRSHGGLKPSNVLLAGGGPALFKTELELTDPYPASLTSINQLGLADRREATELLEQAIELNDLRCIGEIILQLVERRQIRNAYDYNYPIQVSGFWTGLGKDYGWWLELCNKLLDPHLSVGTITLESLAAEFGSRGPKLPTLPKLPALPKVPKLPPKVLIGAGVAVVAVVLLVGIAVVVKGRLGKAREARETQYASAMGDYSNAMARTTFEDAMQALQRALDARPEDLQASNLLFQLVDKQVSDSLLGRDSEGARSWLSKGRDAAPGDWPGWQALAGTISQREKEWASAETVAQAGTTYTNAIRAAATALSGWRTNAPGGFTNAAARFANAAAAAQKLGSAQQTGASNGRSYAQALAELWNAQSAGAFSAAFGKMNEEERKLAGDWPKVGASVTVVVVSNRVAGALARLPPEWTSASNWVAAGEVALRTEPTWTTLRKDIASSHAAQTRTTAEAGYAQAIRAATEALAGWQTRGASGFTAAAAGFSQASTAIGSADEAKRGQATAGQRYAAALGELWNAQNSGAFSATYKTVSEEERKLAGEWPKVSREVSLVVVSNRVAAVFADGSPDWAAASNWVASGEAALPREPLWGTLRGDITGKYANRARTEAEGMYVSEISAATEALSGWRGSGASAFATASASFAKAVNAIGTWDGSKRGAAEAGRSYAQALGDLFSAQTASAFSAAYKTASEEEGKLAADWPKVGREAAMVVVSNRVAGILAGGSPDWLAASNWVVSAEESLPGEALWGGLRNELGRRYGDQARTAAEGTYSQAIRAATDALSGWRTKGAAAFVTAGNSFSSAAGAIGNWSSEKREQAAAGQRYAAALRALSAEQASDKLEGAYQAVTEEEPKLAEGWPRLGANLAVAVVTNQASKAIAATNSAIAEQWLTVGNRVLGTRPEWTVLQTELTRLKQRINDEFQQADAALREGRYADALSICSRYSGDTRFEELKASVVRENAVVAGAQTLFSGGRANASHYADIERELNDFKSKRAVSNFLVQVRAEKTTYDRLAQLTNSATWTQLNGELSTLASSDPAAASKIQFKEIQAWRDRNDPVALLESSLSALESQVKGLRAGTVLTDYYKRVEELRKSYGASIPRDKKKRLDDVETKLNRLSSY